MSSGQLCVHDGAGALRRSSRADRLAEPAAHPYASIVSYRSADPDHAAEERARLERDRAERRQALRERIERATAIGRRARSAPALSPSQSITVGDVSRVSARSSPRNFVLAVAVTLFVLSCLRAILAR
jgi:hypothetical protein